MDYEKPVHIFYRFDGGIYDFSDTRRSASFLRLRGFWTHVKKRNRMDNRRGGSSVIAGSLSVSVSILILIFAVVFLFFCIACVVLTVLSYWLICRKKYKADAWMKIVVFGFALAGCLKLVSFWTSVLLILPVVLSVIVVFGEK